jgi:hypothetical protein
VQGEARLEAVDRLELVAVEDGHMVVAALDHDEQVHRVGGLNCGLSGRRRRREIDDTRGLDLGFSPQTGIGLIGV